MTVANTILQPNGEGYALKRARANVAAQPGDLWAIDTSVGATAHSMPAAPSAGSCIAFGDDTGNASTNAMTITPLGGVLIDGAASYVIDQDDAVEQFIFDGAQYRRIVASRLVFDPVRRIYTPFTELATLRTGAASLFSFSVIGHVRLTGTTGPLEVALSETDLRGAPAASWSSIVAGTSGVIVTIALGIALPTASRRCFHGLHDPNGDFGFLALYQPTVVMSEPSADSIVLAVPFQPVIPVGGPYVVDLSFGLVMV